MKNAQYKASTLTLAKADLMPDGPAKDAAMKQAARQLNQEYSRGDVAKSDSAKGLKYKKLPK